MSLREWRASAKLKRVVVRREVEGTQPESKTTGRCERCNRALDDHCLAHGVTGCPAPEGTSCNATGIQSRFRLKDEPEPDSGVNSP